MSDIDCMCGEPWPCSALRARIAAREAQSTGRTLRVVEGFGLREALTERDVRYIVLDLDATIGKRSLAHWLRHHAAEIVKNSAGGRASVADDMRYIADQIDTQTATWGDTGA